MKKLEICKKCKGSCCKTMGCHYSPEDFKDLSFEGLKAEIDRGFISIDWWEGNPFYDDRNIRQAYYLRSRHINSNIVDASWGGVCSLLTKKGCSLCYKDRPKGGRLLIPKEDKNCIPKYTKEQAAMDWYKYNDILVQLVDYYNCKEEKELLDDLDSKLEQQLNSVVNDFFNKMSELDNISYSRIPFKNNLKKFLDKLLSEK